jgi:sugar lactone lactonase YvrE
MSGAVQRPQEWEAGPAGSRVARWGEGPVWHRGVLYFVDIEGRAVHSFNPDNGEEHAWPVGQRVGFAAPRRVGGLVCGGDHGLFFLDTAGGATAPICDPEPGCPDNRFNDGKCAPDGRLFAGTISLRKETGAARLYRLDADLSLAIAHQPVTNSNGLAWSPDGGTLHYIDTPTRQVTAFSYDPETGHLGGPRIAFATPPGWGSPDGMAADAEGMLWIAFCHGGCVRRLDPADGRELARIELPARATTSVAFGGEGLQDLYITTGITPGHAEPLAGRLFVVRRLPVPGLPVAAFAG